jgi:hypothetical protein
VKAAALVMVARNRTQILGMFASKWHGVSAEAPHRLEPKVLELVRQWGVTPDCLLHDKASLGRSSGSYLSKNGFDGAIGHFGAGRGGRLSVNRRTASALALRRRLDPYRSRHVPFSCGGIAERPQLRQELAELRSCGARPWSRAGSRPDRLGVTASQRQPTRAKG